MTKRTRAYLLPEVLCPTARLDICISIPDDLGHIMPFLAQIEFLANWYAWENDPDRSNDDVAACWREIFNQLRASIDERSGCGVATALQDIRLVDCVLEKQDQDDVWSEVGSIADCVTAGIVGGIESGNVSGGDNYAWYAAPVTNDVNPTETDVACAIATFASDYLIEKFNDNLDQIEAAIGLGVSVAKIAADVADAVAGWAPIVGGIIAAVKDVIEGSVATTFAVIRASDTVEWRSDVKCTLYQRLKDNGADFGATFDPVVTPWIADVKALSPVISPLFGRWLEGLGIGLFRKLAKVSEDEVGECDDCELWCYELDLTDPLPDWLTIEYGTQDTTGIKSESGFLPRTDTTGTAYGALAGFIVTMPSTAIINIVTVTADMQDSASADTRDFNTFYHSELGAGDIDNTTGIHTLVSSPDSEFTASETWTFRVGAGWSGGAFTTGYHIITHLKMTGHGINPFGDNNCTP